MLKNFNGKDQLNDIRVDRIMQKLYNITTNHESYYGYILLVNKILNSMNELQYDLYT